MNELSVRGGLRRPSGFSVDLDLQMPLAGVTAIIGPSGAGKSTLLRLIAGFEPRAPITVTAGGDVWQSPQRFVPAHRRPVSCVFQEGLLFPHLNVAQNLRYPLRRSPRDGLRMTFDEVVKELSLEALLPALPATLSGGQRQRVALARALLAPARLWLLDEPLSALDTKARAEIAPYLRRLCQAHRLPILYVTHALADVLQIADRVLAIEDGRVVANEPIEARELVSRPWHEHGEELSILRAECVRYDERYDLTELALSGERLWVPGRAAGGSTPARSARLLVHARDVSLATAAVRDITMLNRLRAVIVSVEGEDAPSCLVRLDCHGQTLFARITRLSRDQLGLAPGVEVNALIKTMALAAADS